MSTAPVLPPGVSLDLTPIASPYPNLFSQYVSRHALYIYTLRCIPTTIRAGCVFVHGYGEHIDRYHALMSYFATRGILCFGIDQRGYGKTGLKNTNTWKLGDSGGRNTVNADISWMLDQVIGIMTEQGVEEKPVFLFGHSMGGGRVLDYGVHGHHRDRLRGIVCSAPALSVSDDVPWIKITVGNALSYILPHATTKANIDPRLLSHDERVVEEYQASPFNYDVGTLVTLRDIVDIGKEMTSTLASHFTLSVLVMHGSQDKVCLMKGSKLFVEKCASKDVEFVEKQGMYHEMHHEPGWEDQVAQVYVDWILKRT